MGVMLLIFGEKLTASYMFKRGYEFGLQLFAFDTWTIVSNLCKVWLDLQLWWRTEVIRREHIDDPSSLLQVCGLVVAKRGSDLLVMMRSSVAERRKQRR